MRLKLVSRQYLFQKGDLTIINLATPFATPLAVVPTVAIENDVSGEVGVLGPASFQLNLWKVLAVKLNDHLNVPMDSFPIGIVEIDSAGLKETHFEVLVSSRGILNVLVLDSKQQPVPGQRIGLVRAWEDTRYTLEGVTCSQGKHSFFGVNPGEYVVGAARNVTEFVTVKVDEEANVTFRLK